jgi:hypothetical protein
MLGGVCRWRRCVCWVLFVDGGGAYVGWCLQVEAVRMLGGVCRWRRCVCWVVFVVGGGAYVGWCL